MKKITMYAAAFLASTALILSSGCHKLIDYLEEHPDGDFKSCNVKKFNSTWGGRPNNLTFEYNKFGNPVRIKTSNPGTGNPHYQFKYDHKNRLIELFGYYDNPGVFDSWSYYIYDNKGRIIRDTTYWWGEIENSKPVRANGTQVRYYEYDQQNRMTKFTIVSLTPESPEPPQVTNYAYDANGNAILNYPHQYDNKINIHRTNKIWMFLGQEYSVNNPWKASAYNFHNFPVDIRLDTNYRTLKHFLHVYFEEATVEYMCK